MRSAHAESLRLHRARRAGEIQRRDAVLCKADLALQDLKAALGRALIAASRGRYDTPELIAEAMQAADRARLVLREHFDGAT